jgi:hypothetical protein
VAAASHEDASWVRRVRHVVSLGTPHLGAPLAQGRIRRIPFQDEYGAHVGGAHHLALLNHPAVYERLREWLAVSPAELAAGA